MEDCAVCKKALPTDGDFVSCNGCLGKYHYSPCASITTQTYKAMTRDRKLDWRCHKCRQTRSRTNSYSNMQDSQSRKQQRDEDSEAESSDNNKKRLRANEQTVSTSIELDITKLKANMIEVTTGVSDIKKFLEQLNNRLATENDALKKHMTESMNAFHATLSSLASKVDHLAKDNSDKDRRISELEKQINRFEQQTLTNNIEIRNVPQNSEENCMQKVNKITDILNVKITDEDVTDIYRDKKKNIIVKFRSTSKKKEILQKIKNISTKNEDGTKIYINDQLTKKNKKLLWLAKTAARSNGWKFIWVKNGKIFAKQSEEGKIFEIIHENDINIIS